MKEYDIINRLQTAAEDKKSFEARQGSTLAFDTLSNTLGRLFEHYITFILPILLTEFGDSTADVREAVQDVLTLRLELQSLLVAVSGEPDTTIR